METMDLTGFDFEDKHIQSLDKWPLTNMFITKSLLVRKWYRLDRTTFNGMTYSESNAKKWAIGSVLSIIKNGVEIWKDDNYYFVFNIWAKGYYHWITEALLKLVLFEEEIKRGVVILPANCPPFVKEFLALAGFSKFREMKKTAYIKRFINIGNPIEGNPNPQHMKTLREYVHKLLPDTDEQFSKIYISRGKAKQRKIVNEDILIAMLKKKGFHCVALETLSWKDQVSLFKHCTTLLSIHGAGLANCVFMPEGGTVIEVFSKQSVAIRSLNPVYKKLSEASGLTHKYLFSERVENTTPPDFHKDDLVVDVEELSKILQ